MNSIENHQVLLLSSRHKIPMHQVTGFWVCPNKKKKTTLSSDTSKTNCFFFFLMGYDILMQLGFPLAGPFTNFQQDTCGQSVNPPSQKKHVSAGEYVVFLSLFAITTYHWLVVQWSSWKILVNESTGRIIPYIMENKIHVWNHQPDYTKKNETTHTAKPSTDHRIKMRCG